METDWSFQNLAFTLLREVSFGLILLHYGGKILLDTLPKPLWILGYSKLVGPGLPWTLMIVSSNSCGWYFPQLPVVSLDESTDHYSSEYWVGPFAGIWMLSHCAVSICPLLCPVNSSDLGLSGILASPPWPRDTTWFHLSSLLYARDLKLSLHSNRGFTELIQFVFFLWDHGLLMLILSFCCFRWEGKFCASYSILSRSRNLKLKIFKLYHIYSFRKPFLNICEVPEMKVNVIKK